MNNQQSVYEIRTAPETHQHGALHDGPYRTQNVTTQLQAKGNIKRLKGLCHGDFSRVYVLSKSFENCEQPLFPVTNMLVWHKEEDFQ